MNMAGVSGNGEAGRGRVGHGMAWQATPFRAVDALSGDVAERPSKFWAALAEADEELALLDQARELACRVQELEAERDALAAQLKRMQATR